MELLQLRYFCDAAECENFSHTAKKFNVPPSNISRVIRRLENELGAKLFERSCNTVKLSDEGRILYKNAKIAIEAIDSAKRSICEHDGEPSGTIKLLIETNRRIATMAIEKCKTKYPGISLIINHKASGQEFDLTISDIPPKNHTGERVLLISEKMMLASAKEIPGVSEVSLCDIREECFITMSEGSRLFSINERIFEEEGISPSFAIQTDDPYYVRKYVELGLGLAIVPSISWQNSFSENVRLYSIGEYERKTYLFAKPEETLTRAEKLFIDILRECFSEETSTQ